MNGGAAAWTLVLTFMVLPPSMPLHPSRALQDLVRILARRSIRWSWWQHALIPGQARCRDDRGRSLRRLEQVHEADQKALRQLTETAAKTASREVAKRCEPVQ